jgi:2-polyprenyl-6-hydroxyphenyl methylase/3-demethylubiquinone-9 3-methyltransferase
MTINADPQELAKFGELAHRWWDPESDFKPLHQINPLRLGWIQQLCPLAGKRVVDVGCGGGILSDSMARAGAQVLGIDLSTKPLRVAELHAMEAGTEGVEYREIAVEALAAEQPASFDAVTCMEMLEHVPDPASVVRALATLVKPGGAEYVLQMLPKGTHEYARFLKPSELAQFCRDAGLELRTSRGLGYNPLTQRYSMGDDTDVNYLIACQRPL